MSAAVVLLQLLLLNGCQARPVQSERPSPVGMLKGLTVKAGNGSVRIACPLLGSAPTDAGKAQADSSSANVLWILEAANLVITAANDQQPKYVFIQSGGQLEINNVSYKDAGMYRCIIPLKRGTHCAYITSTVSPIFSSVPLNHRQPVSLNQPDKSPPSRNSLRRALISGLFAFIFFCVSCTLYHFRWKPPKSCDNPENYISLLEQHDDRPMSIKRSSLSRSSLEPPKIYLLSSTAKCEPCRLPPPPLLTTTVEMNSVLDKQLDMVSTDAAARSIFLSPPSSTTKMANKRFLATPESTPSSLSLFIEEASPPNSFLATITSPI